MLLKPLHFVSFIGNVLSNSTFNHFKFLGKNKQQPVHSKNNQERALGFFQKSQKEPLKIHWKSEFYWSQISNAHHQVIYIIKSSVCLFVCLSRLSVRTLLFFISGPIHTLMMSMDHIWYEEGF